MDETKDKGDARAEEDAASPEGVITHKYNTAEWHIKKKRWVKGFYIEVVPKRCSRFCAKRLME